MNIQKCHGQDKAYIEDFAYDLNYRKIILYLGHVDKEKLYKVLDASYLNHMYRWKNVVKNNLMFVENCDLQDCTDLGIMAYLDEGYSICPLFFDENAQQYYILMPN